jgi:CubicO group peptidase (beta-lactamase class C family)
MGKMWSSFIVGLALVSRIAASICPILGPVFPASTNLTSSATFRKTLQTIQNDIEKSLESGNTTHGPVGVNDTYSIQIFSTISDVPLLDFHQRGLNLVGNRTVDGDSIYRIASVSKLFTVYLLLLNAGGTIFSDKVTKYLPELGGEAHWDEITIGTLAGYLGGITADPFDVSSLPGGNILGIFPGAFPPLTANETSGCTYGRKGCARDVFIKTLLDRRPVYLPNTTPAYSNTAFAVLGLVLEQISNTSYASTLYKSLIEPLHLNGTSALVPSDASNGIIPGNETVAGWDVDLSDATSVAMGGLFSIPNDLAAIGRAILSSSLLPASTTRAWLKPTSFTSSLLGAPGHAWEIYRAVVNKQHNRIVDLYTKGGNFGAYGVNFVLIPDFGVGFVVMTAGESGNVDTAISTQILDKLLPELDEAARIEADAAYAGTYIATNGLNSTVKLATTPGVPGLSIEQWVSNGTNLRSVWLGDYEWFQMYPTNIVSDDGKQISWRSSFISVPDTGSPFEACPSWFGIDRPTYGVYGVDEYVFHLDENGKAWGLEPKAQKIILQRV